MTIDNDGGVRVTSGIYSLGEVDNFVASIPNFAPRPGFEPGPVQLIWPGHVLSLAVAHSTTVNTPSRQLRYVPYVYKTSTPVIFAPDVECSGVKCSPVRCRLCACYVRACMCACIRASLQFCISRKLRPDVTTMQLSTLTSLLRCQCCIFMLSSCRRRSWVSENSRISTTTVILPINVIIIVFA